MVKYNCLGNDANSTINLGVEWNKIINVTFKT
jgi:hypothetical protein